MKTLVKRILMIVPLLALCGCGEDLCAWLPIPNQEASIDLIGDIRAEGVGRTELFAFLFEAFASGTRTNPFNASAFEASNCIDHLLDQVYGE